MRENTLKSAWLRGENTVGVWISGTDPLVARKLANSGADYVCIDMQHGTADYPQVLALLMAMEGGSAVPIVRVPWNEPGIIGRVLDAGAMGVIIPMVNTVAEAVAAVAACNYPPLGARSNGPIVAADALGPDYGAEANEHIVCIPMIETVEALDAVEDIADVPGIDAFYVGPSDMSRSLGIPPNLEQMDPRFLDASKRIIEAARAKGIAPGVHSTPAMSADRLDFGFQMVTVTSDVQAAQLFVTSSVDAVKAGRSGEGSISGY
ncbi:MAG: HpcH/HpaI aldolase family protein [Acidimicrobiales bacterium]